MSVAMIEKLCEGFIVSIFVSLHAVVNGVN